jgi:hypothetical protein
LGGTAAFRTDLYSTGGTLPSALINKSTSSPSLSGLIAQNPAVFRHRTQFIFSRAAYQADPASRREVFPRFPVPAQRSARADDVRGGDPHVVGPVDPDVGERGGLRQAEGRPPRAVLVEHCALGAGRPDVPAPGAPDTGQI